MISKIINSKLTWIVLVGLVIVLFVVLIALPNNHKDQNKEVIIDDSDVEEITYTFLLKGTEEVSIYLGEKFVDLGYIAIDSNNNDLSEYVTTKTNLKEDEVGEYDISYTLVYKDYKKTLTRHVSILEVEGIDDEVIMKLIGDDVVYLDLNSHYQDLGVSVFYKGEDVSSNVKKVSNVREGFAGNYEVTYYYVDQDIENKITRKVVVIDFDSYFKFDPTKKIININLDDNIKYIIMPNGIVNDNKNINYLVRNDGEYIFKLYTKDLNVFTKKMNIKLRDEIPPSGSCEAILRDGVTTFKVSTMDTDINYYNYNGEKISNISSYSVNRFVDNNAYVILTDLAGNSTKIPCTIKYSATDVIYPKNGESLYKKSESDSLKVYISKIDGYFLTRIWVLNPNKQLKKQVVSGKTTSKPITLLNNAMKENNLEKKILFGFNASGIVIKSWYKELIEKNSAYNYMEPTSLIVTNGKVTLNDYKTYSADYPIYYINRNNQLTYIPRLGSKTSSERKQIFEKAIQDGAYNTFGFTNKAAVENGVANDIDFSGDFLALRQGICQIDTNNFIILTTNNLKIRRQLFAEKLASLGCKTGFNLDGGGSVALLYKDKSSTNPSALYGGGRALTMILYFTEA